mmetsp:Transcript_21632/g.31575  ORF Transcript_21632/g.31575 Transcript_21632/m.31575 type:complete len:168 (+) Transcript_21632:139-642(+)|eukprot:CAMPEP_0197247272 /NCGR_PEP_ID=MMETSP1429-20130617/27643_1 /TAXON_ID=49237 /ORGANISM="Chaetoceros  sp., Strain UNC1202" /LENGTH=167 /DNA_ID=CAMNT_0042708143 /DNA_START=137 /DNA_END=640 /DNA_ORIENTATION=+
MRQSILVLLLAYLTTTLAFTSFPTAFRPTSTRLHAGESDKEGGAAIAKPKVGVKIDTVTTQKSKQVQKRKSKGSDPISRREDDFEDAPMFKVLLIGDESYDQAHVVERMCEIMEDMDENHAATVYKQAQQGGAAMCGKYPLEHAEMYKEQLVRSDPMIYSDVEEENK